MKNMRYIGGQFFSVDMTLENQVDQLGDKPIELTNWNSWTMTEQQSFLFRCVDTWKVLLDLDFNSVEKCYQHIAKRPLWEQLYQQEPTHILEPIGTIYVEKVSAEVLLEIILLTALSGSRLVVSKEMENNWITAITTFPPLSERVNFVSEGFDELFCFDWIIEGGWEQKSNNEKAVSFTKSVPKNNESVWVENKKSTY